MTALELANELIKFDDDHNCRLCSKHQWSETPGQYHDKDCPMTMAYAIIEAAQQMLAPDAATAAHACDFSNSLHCPACGKSQF